MAKQPKTAGLEFIRHSIAAFNGSGYGDNRSVDTFIDSYIAYKRWRKQPNIADMAVAQRSEIEPIVQELLRHTHGAGRRPSIKALAQFAQWYQPAGLPGYRKLLF